MRSRRPAARRWLGNHGAVNRRMDSSQLKRDQRLLPSSSHGSVPTPRTGSTRIDTHLPSGLAVSPTTDGRGIRCKTCPAPAITHLGFGSAEVSLSCSESGAIRQARPRTKVANPRVNVAVCRRTSQGGRPGERPALQDGNPSTAGGPAVAPSIACRGKSAATNRPARSNALPEAQNSVNRRNTSLGVADTLG